MDRYPEMKGHYLVMDNAPIHSSTDIGKYINSRGYRYVYLPPYSPELNPIEQFWSVVKTDQPPKNSKKYDKDLHEAYPSIPVKLGCPCCSALLSDKLTLTTHVVNEHNIPFPETLHENPLNDLGHVDSDRKSPESFSSVEDMPWRTTRTLVNVLNDNTDSVSYDNDEDIQWQVNSVDISKFLYDFRRKSIHDNELKRHKELSLTRILSIHHVFYFPLAPSKSCIAYLTEPNVVQAVYATLKADPVTLPSDIVLWATSIQQAIDSGDRFALEHEFGSILISASQSKNTDIVDAAHVLISLTQTILTHHKQPKRNAEDTFAHRFVAPFLKNIFYGNDLVSLWANSQLVYTLDLNQACTSSSISSSSTPSTSSPTSASPPAMSPVSMNSRLQPDFTSYASVFGYRFDLFVVEIKPPNSSLGRHDFIKLAKEMMSILNQLIRLGLESPLVCGLWIDGHHCEALKMDLRANGVYRLIELDNFELPKSIDDLTKVRTIVQKLLKIKRLIDIMTEDIERSIKKRKASQSSQSSQSSLQNGPSSTSPPNNLASSSSQTSHWIRTPLNQNRVKKIKLANRK
ncbi:hypothetical protein G6F43_012180 [Rhizopus delemar]|nr:hypothetical protein G6F43_012180 [Rhizopus delemar]